MKVFENDKVILENFIDRFVSIFYKNSTSASQYQDDLSTTHIAHSSPKRKVQEPLDSEKNTPTRQTSKVKEVFSHHHQVV